MSNQKYVKVTKPVARKIFNLGFIVYLLPCKVSEMYLYDRESNIKPIAISVETVNTDMNKFDRAVNQYQYCGGMCNAKLGYYASYYVDALDYAVAKEVGVI